MIERLLLKFRDRSSTTVETLRSSHAQGKIDVPWRRRTRSRARRATSPRRTCARRRSGCSTSSCSGDTPETLLHVLVGRAVEEMSRVVAAINAIVPAAPSHRRPTAGQTAGGCGTTDCGAAGGSAKAPGGAERERSAHGGGEAPAAAAGAGPSPAQAASTAAAAGPDPTVLHWGEALQHFGGRRTS